MDERQRRERIERMRREKQKQLRRRKQQKRILKRCAMVMICVAVVLLGISAVWAVVKGKRGSEPAEQTVMEVEAGAQQEAVDVEASEKTEPETVSASASTAAGSDTQAQEVPLDNGRVPGYAVPGWQVDESGWWYAGSKDTYLKGGWQELDGERYYFNEDGYMQTGWTVIGSRGCFFNENGVYEPDKESKMIALTFDDGPDQYTAELLDILEENGAKATFFMLGENVERYGADTVPRMKELGCEIGNHSYNHPNLKDLDEQGVREQFDRTDQLLVDLIGEAATVARTPFGSQDETITGYIEKPCIYWSLDTLDWQTKDVASNISAVLNHVSDGEIVLMHDIWPTTVEACRTIIPELVQEGYQLVTVSELAVAKGIRMENGITYYDFYPQSEDAA